MPSATPPLRDDAPPSAPLAIFHEHPDWFRPLFAELDRRGVPYDRLDAARHAFDPFERRVPHAVVFNRASPSAFLRGARQSTFHTLHWLRHLERLGVDVVNGSHAYGVELSKAIQLDLLAALGIAAPRTVVVNHPAQAVAAARRLRFPVLTKANVGGSGAGIARWDTLEQLAAAAQAGGIDFGVDGVALVQELAPLRDGRITRIETLGGDFLYAIHVHPDDGLAAPGVAAPGGAVLGGDGRALARAAAPHPLHGLRVELATDVPSAIVARTEAIARAAQLDVGGIEWLRDDRDGAWYALDVNALSNFVPDGPAVLGFDPYARLADLLQARLAIAGARPGARLAHADANAAGLAVRGTPPIDLDPLALPATRRGSVVG